MTVSAPMLERLTRVLTLAALGAWASAGLAADVACHVIYGGEETAHRVLPAADPYKVPTIPVGSYFLFRPLLETAPEELVALKVYVYADLDRGPVIVHQGEYDWPPVGSGRYGFTGRQRAYEPMRDGELEYWCEAAE